jgi:two-component system, NarL family, invasion response regulator UvrY
VSGRFLVVDDHAVVRRGLTEILREAFPGASCEEAGAAREALAAFRAGRWDAVILDVGLPDRSGLDVLKEMKAHAPATPVLVLSVHAEAPFAVRALKAGASAYLSKESAPEELVAAVKKARSGGRYVSAALAERLADVVAAGGGEPHESLSDREFEVLRLIASGKTVSEAAEFLHLSVKTVSTYRARILEKTGMKSNAELTHYAISRGLVS